MKVYFYRQSYAPLFDKRLIAVKTEHCRCTDNVCKDNCRVMGWSIRIGSLKIVVERKQPKGCKTPF